MSNAPLKCPRVDLAAQARVGLEGALKDIARQREALERDVEDIRAELVGRARDLARLEKLEGVLIRSVHVMEKRAGGVPPAPAPIPEPVAAAAALPAAQLVIPPSAQPALPQAAPSQLASPPPSFASPGGEVNDTPKTRVSMSRVHDLLQDFKTVVGSRTLLETNDAKHKAWLKHLKTRLGNVSKDQLPALHVLTRESRRGAPARCRLCGEAIAAEESYYDVEGQTKCHVECYNVVLGEAGAQ